MASYPTSVTIRLLRVKLKATSKTTPTVPHTHRRTAWAANTMSLREYRGRVLNWEGPCLRGLDSGLGLGLKGRFEMNLSCEGHPPVAGSLVQGVQAAFRVKNPRYGFKSGCGQGCM